MPHPTLPTHPHTDASHSSGNQASPASISHTLQRLPGGQERCFERGEFITRPDQGENRIFQLIEGNARICLSADQKELTLGCLSPGSLYVSHTRAWIEALEPCKAIFWPLQALTGLLEQHPAAAIAALREVGLILNRATDLIEDLAFRSVESRLARYFLLEARNQQSSQIQLTGTTELIASLLGTSRQTLSSVLNQMEREGLINRPARQQVILKNPTELEKVASVSAS